MTAFIHEEGLGNMMGEDGKDVAMLGSDSYLFPIEMIPNYDQYMDLKPPERMVIRKTESNEEILSKATAPNRKSYRCYKDAEKEELVFLVYKKGM
ncbi:hypothetical protein BX666DRAFT_1886508 [Dichotomocladium elegans]|nr:hypothetical protein BX666DRAFT_1886508 [Dichotomocladium elegans]